MKAIVSDIHGNLEALNAVMDDIEQHDVDEILCLGDIVGYGPNPVECLDIGMANFKWVLCGNHEWALVNQPVGFSPTAKRAIEITKGLFELETEEDLTAKRNDFLFNLEPNVEDGPFMFVHGSPKDPIMDYVFPEQFSRFWSEDKVDDLLRTVEWACFCGHSHVPSVISSTYQSLVPLQDDETHVLEKEKKYIVNVGAVGQPRDRNNKSCYVLWEDDTVTFRRIAYDFDVTAEKMRKIGFDERLSSRLAEGT